MTDRSALFVRLTSEQAGRLDQAAAAVPARKQDLIGGLVERYVDPSTPAGIEALRELTYKPPTVEMPRSWRDPVVKRVPVDLGGSRPDVLDAAGAAELMAVEVPTIVDLAERGELPGRQIGGAWRFSRQALLDWLSRDI